MMIRTGSNSDAEHSREQAIAGFIVRHGWEGAQRVPISGDASFRRYERLIDGNESVILMDAPPQEEEVLPFIHVSEFLYDAGFSAPKVLCKDVAEGLLLLEDLGDDLFSRVLEKEPGQEERIYIAAGDVLSRLHGIEPPADMAEYSEALLLQEVMLFVEWYLPSIMGQDKAFECKESFCEVWKKTLRCIPAFDPVVVLRDFHADNLIWLPQREDIRRVGLLDFQDAVVGSPAYDMVSFLDDIRRNVATSVADAVLEHYVTGRSLDKKDFAAACAILSVQRNTKIIGIFTRLSLRDGKHHYLNMIPNVWHILERSLEHPELSTVREWFEVNVPREMRVIPEKAGSI